MRHNLGIVDTDGWSDDVGFDEAVDAAIKVAPLTPNEKVALDGVRQGTSARDLADELHVTQRRARALIVQALRKVRQALHEAGE